MQGLSEVEVAGRLLLGTLLGGVIGLERQVHGRPAGFRTHLLVCVASVLLMLVSAALGGDPGRLAAGAITGVGFLGAGVILKSGRKVHGLTTAACLWIVSAIGLAVGAGFVFAACVACGITFLALWILRRVEDRLPRLAYKYVMVVADRAVPETAIREAVESRGPSITRVTYELDAERDRMTYRIAIASDHKISERDILDCLATLPSVRRVVVHD